MINTSFVNSHTCTCKSRSHAFIRQLSCELLVSATIVTEAIFCEGQCEAWYHRRCAGISKSAYESASESENPFYCMSCLQVHYNNKISQLKEQIAALSSKILGLSEGDTSQTSASGPGSNTITQYSSTALPNSVTNSSHKN